MIFKMPLVSIIIPSYNSSKFLSETIDSVIAQSYGNWELIIVDDGSTDDTSHLVKRYLNDVRIKYLYQENSGVSAARNYGYQNSKGDFVAFLDSDDVWLPESIEKKYTYLHEHADCGIVFGKMQIIDQDSKLRKEILDAREGHILKELLLWKTMLPSPSSILVRRSVIEIVGLFEEKLSTAADQDFYFRCSAKYKIGKVNSVCGYYRVHTSNMSKNTGLFEKDHLLVYKRAEEFGLFKSHIFKRICFSNMYLILAGVWWINGESRKRGLWFILRSVLAYPPVLFDLFAKMIKNNNTRA